MKPIQFSFLYSKPFVRRLNYCLLVLFQLQSSFTPKVKVCAANLSPLDELCAIISQRRRQLVGTCNIKNNINSLFTTVDFDVR